MGVEGDMEEAPAAAVAAPGSISRGRAVAALAGERIFLLAMDEEDFSNELARRFLPPCDDRSNANNSCVGFWKTLDRCVCVSILILQPHPMTPPPPPPLTYHGAYHRVTRLHKAKIK